MTVRRGRFVVDGVDEVEEEESFYNCLHLFLERGRSG